MASTVGPIPYYLDILSQWPTAIPPESQWFITISLADLNFLKSNFISRLRRYETGGDSSTDWNISQQVVNTLIKPEYQEGNDLLGCVFASRVSIPSESVQASNQGLEYGGYQAPVTMNVRDPYKKLSVTFIETNSSFLDFVIRPWIISVGYFGFITRASGFNVKAKTLDVVYIAKAGSGRRALKRKVIRFYGVAPVSIGSVSNQYSSDSVQNVSVDFVYDYYTVNAEDTNSQNSIRTSKTNKNETNYENSNASGTSGSYGGGTYKSTYQGLSNAQKASSAGTSGSYGGGTYSDAALRLALRGAPEFYYTPFARTLAAQQAQFSQSIYGGSFFAVRPSPNPQ